MRKLLVFSNTTIKVQCYLRPVLKNLEIFFQQFRIRTRKFRLLYFVNLKQECLSLLKPKVNIQIITFLVVSVEISEYVMKNPPHLSTLFTTTGKH